MANAFIFHGTEGYPEENWFPWLKGQLESLDYRVIVPQFPTPKDQTLENWFKVLDEYKDAYNEDTILIGHSLGGAFLLRVLEKYDTRVKGAYIVSAPIGVKPILNYEGDQPFIGKPFDWERIRNNAEKFCVFHSNDDPYVSLGNGQQLAEHLGIELTFVENAGHFNAKAGYLEFPLLLDKITQK